MRDWNVVVTVYDAMGRREAKRALRKFGDVERTPFFNVLVMRVADVASFIDEFAQLVAERKDLLNDIARLLPAQAVFDFETVEEFEERSREIVLEWAPRLVGRSFHVRLNRRGLKGVLETPKQERFLDDAVLEKTADLGQPARISFADPDYVIDVETVGNRAGVSLWSREELSRYPFLRIE